MAGHERTRLLAVLTAAIGLATAVLIAVRGAPIAPLRVIAVILVPWTALSIILRLTPKTWGREGRYLDFWSVAHAVAGGLLGIVGIGALWVLVLTVIWEGIEIVCRVTEHPPNRVIDVALALASWAAAQAVFAVPYPLW